MPSSSIFAGIDADAYRRLCAQFATGVAVATVRAANGTPHGLTVSSFTPVSIDPPLILICIDFRCTAIEHFRTAPFFAISILTEVQRELSVAFAAKPEGRFEGIEWTAGETGAPLLAGGVATLECSLDHVRDVGDHALIFGRVVHGSVHGGQPLLYFDRSYRAVR